MSCPICHGHLYIALPAVEDQEPVMGCNQCGRKLTTDQLELWFDRALDRELIQELKPHT